MTSCIQGGTAYEPLLRPGKIDAAVARSASVSVGGEASLLIRGAPSLRHLRSRLAEAIILGTVAPAKHAYPGRLHLPHRFSAVGVQACHDRGTDGVNGQHSLRRRVANHATKERQP